METLTEVAGPAPLKYAPCTSTPVTFQPGPAGTSKSSAASSSNLVERGFEVLRVRADRSGVVVLIVEDDPR
jgi:hypothetical protein